MKLIAIMGLKQHKENIRRIFAEHDVQIYSEIEMAGHTSDTIKQHGWWVFEQSDVEIYSTMYFSIVSEPRANEVMLHIKNLQKEKKPEHPPRAFQVAVEKLI